MLAYLPENRIVIKRAYTGFHETSSVRVTSQNWFNAKFSKKHLVNRLYNIGASLCIYNYYAVKKFSDWPIITLVCIETQPILW